MNWLSGYIGLYLLALAMNLMLQNADSRKSKKVDERCGQLNEKVLYNNKVEAAPTEYPWIGRLLVDMANETLTTRCLGSLVSKQHVILPAHCIYDNGGPDDPNIFTMQMRLWKQISEKIRSCNPLGYCTKKPKWYTLIDIKVHPYFDKFTTENNIAIGTLNRTVKFSNYLQPICLEATKLLHSFVGKYFFMGGFRLYQDIKTKTGAVVLTPRYCNDHYAGIERAVYRTQLCAHQELNDYMEPGSPIMGINIEQNVLKSFYLVGHLVGASKTERPATPIVSFYTNIQWFVPWIKENLIFVTKNKTKDANAEK